MPADNVDWDALDAPTLKWLHEWGKDSEIRAHGYGDQLDDYLGSLERGEMWDPHDMSGTPEPPLPSALDPDGRRYTLDTSGSRTGHESGHDGDPDALPSSTDYDRWHKKDLVAECDRRGLPTSGVKDDLVARLQEHDAGEEDVPPYEEWDEDDLRAECRERGMRTGGTKEQLIEALNKYDAEIAKGGDN